VFQSPLHRGTLFNSICPPSARRFVRSFSPLFIGELSSTQRPWRSQRRRSGFSPLFIGELSSTHQLGCGRQRHHRFSPLFIGELSSTISETAFGAGHSSFQSPLHRGTLFNSDENFGLPGRPQGFSPLFIGELSSTRALLRFPTLLSSFQSPLHRGTLFNAACSGPHNPRPWVSVPSSSGNSLQRRRPGSGRSGRAGFSPLFIGELSSTLLVTSFGYGSLCFSPLFIGELSSTALACPARVRRGVFQSPLHRGTLFNPAAVQASLPESDVSVPSSSGNSLQR